MFVAESSSHLDNYMRHRTPPKHLLLRKLPGTLEQAKGVLRKGLTERFEVTGSTARWQPTLQQVFTDSLLRMESIVNLRIDFVSKWLLFTSLIYRHTLAVALVYLELRPVIPGGRMSIILAKSIKDFANLKT